MIEYRSFHNSDPPQIAALWNACGLGRGAAGDLSTDAFEIVSFSRPGFDRAGLIVACDGPKIVGFVHAGFGCNEQQSAISHETGVICAVMVHLSHRRQGIGRELVSHAERYLTERGAVNLQAGSAFPLDPFYAGLYGGTESAGFLESDALAEPFITSLGYRPLNRHIVFQRNIAETNPPVNFRLMAIRRKSQLAILDGPSKRSWWWHARFGFLDSIRFALVPKDCGNPLASLTILGLDLYVAKWQWRAVGILDLSTGDTEDAANYGEALIAEVSKRLRQELVSIIEIHSPSDDVERLTIIENAGFEQMDAGTVFRKAM